MRLVLVLAAAVLLSACGGGTSGATDSGLRGRALLGPACPVEPCSLVESPYRGSFVVRKDGVVVEKVRTDGEGRFEVRLEPGRYVVESEADAEALPLLKAVEITVREREFSNVTLHFDSGIR